MSCYLLSNPQRSIWLTSTSQRHHLSLIRHHHKTKKCVPLQLKDTSTLRQPVRYCREWNFEENTSGVPSQVRLWAPRVGDGAALDAQRPPAPLRTLPGALPGGLAVSAFIPQPLLASPRAFARPSGSSPGCFAPVSPTLLTQF